LGANNSALGDFALFSNITGGQNVAIGQSALQGNTASNNTAIGFQAALTNASRNTAITAIGYQALTIVYG
jgi:trimeric autotransporter adhesin